MTQIPTSDSKGTNETKLPPSDWIVLPLVGLATICLLAGSVELTGHRLFSVSKASLNDCLVMNDAVTGHGGTYISVLQEFRGIPKPEQYYFPVDGRPVAPAPAIFAKLIAKQLISGAVPALRGPSLQASY